MASYLFQSCHLGGSELVIFTVNSARCLAPQKKAPLAYSFSALFTILDIAPARVRLAREARFGMALEFVVVSPFQSRH